jgi:hypothetical protein
VLFAAIDDDSETESNLIDYPFLDDDNSDSISNRSSSKLNASININQLPSNLQKSDFKFEKSTHTSEPQRPE